MPTGCPSTCIPVGANYLQSSRPMVGRRPVISLRMETKMLLCLEGGYFFASWSSKMDCSSSPPSELGADKSSVQPSSWSGKSSGYGCIEFSSSSCIMVVEFPEPFVTDLETFRWEYGSLGPS